MIVCLDMDNVLVDWANEAYALWGERNFFERNRVFRGPSCWEPGELLFPDEPHKFWAHPKFDDPTWWASLPKTPWADRLVREAGGNKFILTSLTDHAGPAHGKRAWIKIHYPSLYRRMQFCDQKWLLAQPGAVLVDDKEENIVDWRKAGGIGILVPAYWNSLHEHVREAGDIVVTSLVRTVYGR